MEYDETKDMIIDTIYDLLNSYNTNNAKVVEYTNLLGEQVIKIEINNTKYLVSCEKIEVENEE